MDQETVTTTGYDLEITSIGGIDHTTATVDPGVTVLTGRNATNRTSFLQAIMAACGSERATLKADADEGSVELTTDGETYTRTLTRRNGQVHFGGTPYLDDPMLADLFAFLLESNEARRAVARGDDLREIIMRPVDTAEIEREIRELESERDDIDEELRRLDSLKERLPELEEEKRRLESEIAEKEARIEEKNREIEAKDTTVEAEREEKRETEAKIDELSEKRQELRSLDRRLATERESLDNLATERDELEAELADIDTVSDDRAEQIEQEIQRLRGRIQGIESTVGDLQSVIQFNEEFLEEGRPDFLERLASDGGSSADDITGRLLDESEDVVCWTCGSTVETDQIETTLEELRAVRNDAMGDRRAIEAEIEELQEEKSELDRKERAYQRTQEKLAQVEAEIEDRQATVNDLEERREELEATVDRLGAAVDDLREAEQSEILAAQKELSRLEAELDGLRSEREDIESEIDSIESTLSDRDRLERQREEVVSDLTDRRNRVEDLQEEAIEAFNEHMSELLDRLGYENLERIWIERTSDEVREGRRKVSRDQFDLHIVRSTDSGAVYEDTIDHLSESEREVTGLVFALAGYLVHDVYEAVPFMLLDSIEAIDPTRIARLVEYLEGYADCLVVALLEEDAAALEGSYPEIESI